LRWQSAAVDAVRDDRRLAALEKLVLFILISHADEHGACWVSFNTLAFECGFGRSSGLRVIGRLEKKKRVLCLRTRGPNNERACNTYRVTLATRGGSVPVTPPGVTETPGSVREAPEQTNPSGSLIRSAPLSISETSLPPGGVGGTCGEKTQQEIPSSWIAEARRSFAACNVPSRFLRPLAVQGFTEQEGAEYLRGARRATDLPKEDHRALGAWCSETRSAPWLARRRRRVARAVVDRPPTAAEIAKSRELALKGGADVLRSLRTPAAGERSTPRTNLGSTGHSKAPQRGV
jgi:hypothetical protein